MHENFRFIALFQACNQPFAATVLLSFTDSGNIQTKSPLCHLYEQVCGLFLADIIAHLTKNNKRQLRLCRILIKNHSENSRNYPTRTSGAGRGTDYRLTICCIADIILLVTISLLDVC